MLDNTIMDIMDRFSNQLTDFFEENLINLDEDIYPTILTLLAINLTLPVSVASAERSFSSLKRLKTYLRHRMNQDRLTGLALLSIHVNIDDVIFFQTLSRMFISQNPF
jgi:hypothetical protein